MASSRFGCNDGLSLASRMSDRRDNSRARRARLVRVAQAQGETAYARCRDLSDTGMKLDLSAPLELNDVVAVAMSPSIVLRGTVAWINGRECGIAFDCPVDAEALLDATAPLRTTRLAPTLDLLSGREDLASVPPPPQRDETSSVIGFQPGLAVTLMGAANHEERGRIRWVKQNFAALELSPTDTIEPAHTLQSAPDNT